MAKARPPLTFQTVVDAYPPAVQRLAVAARAFIREVVPGLDESVDSSGPYIGYGYGTGYKGTVCYLTLSKAGVKLGVAGGAALADPHRLLEGRGKVHRHVVLKTPADLQRPGTRELIEAAERTSRKRIGVPAR